MKKRPLPASRPALASTLAGSAMLRCALQPNTPGADTQRFEQALGTWLGAEHALALSSVRMGLYLTLRALDLPQGSRVLCSSLTVYPVIEAIQAAGMTPRFVDLDPDTLSMDLRAAAERCDDSARVLLVTHLWGQAAPMEPMLELARARELVLLEDVSHTLGGRIHGRALGTFGRAGLFSFGPTKFVSTIKGGALITQDSSLAHAIGQAVGSFPPESRRSIMQGAALSLGFRALTTPTCFRLLGHPLLRLARRSGVVQLLDGTHQLQPNERTQTACLGRRRRRFGDLQAKAGLACLAEIEPRIARRRAIADRYRRELAGLPNLTVHHPRAGHQGSHWVFPVFHPRAEALGALLADRHGIDTTPTSLDACHALPRAPWLAAELPVSSALHRQVRCLPMHEDLGDREIDYVVSALRSACAML
jgi:perosamine synthetase